MRLLDISFRAPARNLALDEVLLDSAEKGRGGETLRFWESPVPCVVLGVAQALRQEVLEKQCLDDHVPILRRCSAGGCVVQGPGCLNYSLVLRHADRPDTQTVRGSYCHILGRLTEAFRRRGLSVRHNGVSDLSFRGKKVSGSAQKRRRTCFLHHGTLLYAMDAETMEKYLREPPEDARPRYRGERTHRGFVANLPLTARELRELVCEAFDVKPIPAKLPPREQRAAQDLAAEKYDDAEWTYRR